MSPSTGSGGAVEASHGPLKKTLEEALTLRGSRGFAALAGYQAFLAETIARKNAPRRQAVAIELAAMGPLPRHRTTDFSVYTVSVTRSGTISVRGVLYTVPARLVGGRLKVHVGACPRAARTRGPGGRPADLLSRDDAGDDRRAALLSAQRAAPAGR